MSADIIEISGRAEGRSVMRWGAGGAATPPAASPEQKVLYARRWCWRGAYRLAAGEDIGAGYRYLARCVAGALVDFMGPTAAASVLADLAMEALEMDDSDGPEAA